MGDVLKPSASLLIKIGSAVIHAEEFLSPTGHPFDKNVFDGLLRDPEVAEWIKAMDELALLPKKRSANERRKTKQE